MMVLRDFLDAADQRQIVPDIFGGKARVPAACIASFNPVGSSTMPVIRPRPSGE